MADSGNVSPSFGVGKGDTATFKTDWLQSINARRPSSGPDEEKKQDIPRV